MADTVLTPTRSTRETPSPNRARFIYELTAGNSISGQILGIKPSFTCEFPDDIVGCTAGGVGINLYNYKVKYPIGFEPVMFDKITITAGTCLVYVE